MARRSARSFEKAKSRTMRMARDTGYALRLRRPSRLGEVGLSGKRPGSPLKHKVALDAYRLISYYCRSDISR
jgi:hypothetical protein